MFTRKGIGQLAPCVLFFGFNKKLINVFKENQCSLYVLFSVLVRFSAQNNTRILKNLKITLFFLSLSFSFLFSLFLAPEQKRQQGFSYFGEKFELPTPRVSRTWTKPQRKHIGCCRGTSCAGFGMGRCRFIATAQRNL